MKKREILIGILLIALIAPLIGATKCHAWSLVPGPDPTIQGHYYGYVKDSSGNPLYHALVSLYAPGGSKIAADYTSSSGYYDFVTDVYEGNVYTLKATKSGYNPQSKTVLGTSSKRTDFSLTRITYSYRIYGYVKKGSTAISGATVKISRSGTTKTDTTSSNGYYSITFTYTSSGSKTFSMTVSKSGYVTETRSVSMNPGSSREDFDLDPYYYYTIDGIVSDGVDGSFMKGAKVKITGPGSIVKTDYTDSGGYYSITFAYTSSGTKSFTIEVSEDDYVPQTKTISMSPGTKSQNFVLVYPLFKISGTVKDADGYEINAASITVYAPDGTSKSTTTNELGYFHVDFYYPSEDSEEFTIEVAKDGFETKTVTFTADPGSNHQVIIIDPELEGIPEDLEVTRYWSITLGTYEGYGTGGQHRQHDDYYFHLEMYEFINPSTGKFSVRYYIRMDYWEDITRELPYTEYDFSANYLHGNYWYPVWNITTLEELEQSEKVYGNFYVEDPENGTILHRWIEDSWWLGKWDAEELTSGYQIGFEAGLIDLGYDYDPEIGFIPESTELVGCRLKFQVDSTAYGEPTHYDSGASTNYFFYTKNAIDGIYEDYCSYKLPDDGAWLYAYNKPFDHDGPI